MATYTLRPNANWNNASSWTISGGAGSVHAALADTSDTTYITRTSTTIPASYEMEMGTQSLGATEVIKTVNLRVKIAQTDGNTKFSIGVITDTNGRVTSYSVPVARTGTFALGIQDTGLLLTTAPNGANWTQTLLNSLVVKVTDDATTSGARANIYEVFVDVVTATKPTVTVTAPSGTITDTSFPSINWTYAQSDGLVQNGYQIKIFDSATYSAGGFDPNTTTPTEDTGEVIAQVDGATLETDLANSTTYRAYVQVHTLVNSLKTYSDWAYSQFTLSVEAPASPVVTTSYDSNEGAVSIIIYGRTNVLSANQASLEVDTAGWDAVTNCTITRSTAQAASGSASLSMSATASGNMEASTTTATKFSITANLDFSAIASFRSAAVSRSASVGIRYLNSAGATISTTYGTAVTTTTSSWTEASASVLAPPTATHAQVFVKIASAGTSEVHYVDKIGFHSGEMPTWTKGGFSNFKFDVERQQGTNTTWDVVRNSPVTANSSQIAILSDYEVPLSTTVKYRAKARADI